MQAKHKNEAATATDGSGVDISKNLLIESIAEAHGTYAVTHIGPRDECRDEYCRLRDELWAFEKAGEWVEEARIKALKALMTPMEELKGEYEAPNIVTTVGKDFALNTFLDGSGYTKTGPYIGLINANASTAVLADTMGSHASWLEVGGANAPTMSSNRATVSWSAASGGEKQTASPAAFAITGTGTVGGCFLVFGTGAVNTKDSTAGILYSAGAFTGGSRTVNSGDTLNVTYKATL